MTIKTIQEGFALMGATLAVHKGFVSVELRGGVRIDIRLDLSDSQLEAALFFLKLNIPNWYKLVKEALAEESDPSPLAKADSYIDGEVCEQGASIHEKGGRQC